MKNKKEKVMIILNSSSSEGKQLLSVEIKDSVIPEKGVSVSSEEARNFMAVSGRKRAEDSGWEVYIKVCSLTYTNIYSCPTFRLILVMIAKYDLQMVEIDVKTFYNNQDTILEDCGMIENPWLPKTFFKWTNGEEFVIMGEHNDDAIFGGTSLEVINETLDQIEKSFKLVRNYAPQKILGCTVERDRERRLLKLHQSGYDGALKEIGQGGGKHQELLDVNQISNDEQVVTREKM